MNIELVINLIIGFVIAGLICAAAYRFELLSANGAFLAVFIGALIFGLGGLSWAMLLVVFFLSSSILPEVRVKLGYLRGMKKPKRNWRQVIVNGGPGVLLLLISFVIDADLLIWTVYCGVIAAVTADTWATEIGIMSRNKPRSIISWKVVEKGFSGAVSLLGFAAAFSGSLMIGTLWFLFNPSANSIIPILSITAAGFIGALIDSLLGDVVQAQYLDQEGNITEDAGKNRKLIRGWRWVDNDVVNLVCALVGGFTAFLIGF